MRAPACAHAPLWPGLTSLRPRASRAFACVRMWPQSRTQDREVGREAAARNDSHRYALHARAEARHLRRVGRDTRAMRARATSSRRLLRSTRALTPAVAFRAWAATASLAHLAHGVRAAAALSLAQTHARAAHRRAHGRVFAAWRALSARAHACAALLHRASSRRKARAEQSVFTAWRMCARVRSRARARFASVRHRTVSAVFDAWRCRTRDEQLRSRALTAVCSQHYRATTRAGFNRWARPWPRA